MDKELALQVLSACAILLTDGEEMAKNICTPNDIVKAKYIVGFLKTYPNPNTSSDNLKQ